MGSHLRVRFYLLSSISSMVSGKHLLRVSGNVLATKPPSMAVENKTTCGSSFQTSSSKRIRGAMATPNRAMKELKPIPFCLGGKK